MNYRFSNKIYMLLSNNLSHFILKHILPNTILFYSNVTNVTVFNILNSFFDLYNNFHKKNYLIVPINNAFLQWVYANTFNCFYLNIIFTLIYPYLSMNPITTIKKNPREFFNNSRNYNCIINAYSLIIQVVLSLTEYHKDPFFES